MGTKQSDQSETPRPVEPGLASPSTDVAEPGFDALLSELQALVETLESADLPLERSLAAFERGVSLARRGQQILDAAERKVELLLRDGSTAPLESPDRASPA